MFVVEDINGNNVCCEPLCETKKERIKLTS